MNDDKKQQEFHLRDYWQVLVRRRWIVVTCVVVTTVAAAVSSYLATPIYRATARISIERQGVRIVRQTLTSAEPSWIDYQNFYNTQYQYISSNAVLQIAAEKLDLENRDVMEREREENPLVAKLSEFKRRALAVISSPAPQIEPVDDEHMRPYIEFLRGGLEVEPVRDSHLVDISFVSPDPRFAAEAANAVCDAYKDFTLNEKLEIAQASQEFFAGRIKKLKDDVHKLEKELEDFARQKGIVAQAGGKDISMEELVDLRQKYTEAKALVKEKEAALERVLKTPAASLSEVRRNATIQNLQNEINRLEGEYQEALATKGSALPEVRQIKAQLDVALKSLEQQTLSIASRVRDAARADLRAARSHEQGLANLFNTAKERVQDLQQAIAEYETLRAQTEHKRQALNDLLTRLNDMDISASLGDTAHNVRVIDRAFMPRSIYKPKKRLNVALGFLFGLFLGVGAAILLEYIDNTLKTPDDVRNVLGVSVLGLVPAYGSRGKTRSRQAQGEEGADGAPTDPALVTARAPMSPIAESYRELRTALLLAVAGHPPRDIGVTSCQPSEGKTTTAINLATALAQLGKRVLLVDADLRRPRCHQVMGVSSASGVSNYLTGHDDIESLVQPTSIERVSLLPAGPIPPNPAELLDSTRFAQLVEALRSRDHYDHVIFDTPPVLSVVDPLLVGRKLEGMVLVIRSAFTSREAGRLGKEKLDTGRVNLLGIVLNAVQTDHVPYQYRYYRYGYSEDSRRGRKKPVGAGKS